MSVEDLLWAAAEPTVFVTREQYLASLAGWTIREHTVGGDLVMLVLTRGPELHFVTFGKSWSMTRADLRHYLEPVLCEHGYVTTRTPLEDARQRRFNKILGFEETGEDEFYVHLTLRRLSFFRSTPCR